MNAVIGWVKGVKPRIVLFDGKWYFYAALGGGSTDDKNFEAWRWVTDRNVPGRRKPKRCPVPQDDVCDYGRGITLEDAPRQQLLGEPDHPWWINNVGVNDHGPFN